MLADRGRVGVAMKPGAAQGVVADRPGLANALLAWRLACLHVAQYGNHGAVRVV
jgi:hypothetical protein